MSERDLTSSVKDELTKANIRLALFLEIIFDDGPFRVWSGIGQLTLNGVVFEGVGDLGKIDKIEEVADDVRASGVAMTLSGIPTSSLSIVLNENFQGRPATIWLGMFDSNWQLINDAIKLNGYRLDYPVINEAGDSCSITVYAESILADLERPRVRRYTALDQAELFPGDKGLDFVTAIQNQDTVWQDKPSPK